MGQKITHRGIITQISDGKVTVTISPQADECGGCAVSLMCDKQEKLEIPTDNPEKYRKGQSVTVGMEVGIARKGTILFFLMPIIILLSALILSIHAGAEEWEAALISLCTVGVWYAVLYGCRQSLRAEAEFKIVKSEK